MSYIRSHGRSLRSKTCLIASICAILLVFSLETSASPTIIHDNRVTGTGTTPLLGRGYSISTNTFQSSCMKTVITTTPSYDFVYIFKSIDKNKYSKTSRNLDAAMDATFEFISSHLEAHKKDEEALNMKYQHVQVEIDMTVYYASVDESQSKMNDSAVSLLRKKDLIGFFMSCGAYYTRSIGRRAKLISIFTYKSEEADKNSQFEAALKLAIKGFMGKADVNASASINTKFNEKAENKELTITTRGYGLGKNVDASLIAYDLETFKGAIKQAFLSMQNPLTGKVENIEVIPWVENTEFQDLVDLQQPAKNPAGLDMMNYEKKMILNTNAEFVTEINRTDRSMMNTYYKARICKLLIIENWKDGDNFKPMYENSILRNNRGGSPIPLKEFDAYLSEQKIADILKSEMTYMYGTDGVGGAATCMRDILNSGFYIKNYFEIPSCRIVKQKTFDPDREKIENYCMPILDQK